MENKIEQLVRKNILNMQAYSSARDEYTGDSETFLDANENPYGQLNRYPDPYQKKLKIKISQIKSIAENQIFIGNGSDEVIDLLYRIFCQPQQDKSISFTPGYGMYQVSASIQNIEHINLSLTTNFQINRDALTPYLSDAAIKLLFICSPNNPTGNLIEEEDILWILDNYHGILVIDEAYIDFSRGKSWLTELVKNDSLVILQTLSKAWGLAGARVGMAYAHPTIIQLLNKVKPPYNISQLNQQAAIEALDDIEANTKQINMIRTERERMRNELGKITAIEKIYPSESNFLLIKVNNANEMYQTLLKQKIIVRNQSSKIDNCLRVSIGTHEENNTLIKTLKNEDLNVSTPSEYGFATSLDYTNRH